MSVSLPPSLYDVSDAEALTEDCPQCERPAGKRCVYLNNVYDIEHYPYRTKKLKHRKGSQTQKPHNQRRRAFAEARLVRWREQNPDAAYRLDAIAAGRPVRAEDIRRAQIERALREYGRRENDKLKDWLREHGHILWEDPRPDGTQRGSSYSLGAALEEIDGAFSR